jgi:peptide deformylase
MNELKVSSLSDPIVNAVSQPVGGGVPLHDLLEQMRKVQQLYKQPCVVAKHVGVNVRVVLVNTSFDRNRLRSEPINLVMVNPDLEEYHNPLLAGLESDLLIPDYQGSVERHAAVRVRFLDEHFNEHDELLTDLAARWAVHGIELLDGKLFIDHLNQHRQRSIKGHLKRIASNLDNGQLNLENASQRR